MNFKDKSRPWWIIGAAILFYPLVVISVFFMSRNYVVDRAEKDIETMLLQHKGVHQYVQRLSHPELYSLKENNGVPEALYSPVLFSSSYMVRNMHQFYNEERQRAGLPKLYYKMAATNPRNPVNLASDYEARLIRLFNEDLSQNHYQEIVKIAGRKYLYVAIPFLRNNQNCLKCHGKFEDAPKQLQALYPRNGGFNENVGYIRAIESLRAPLSDEWTLAYVALISAGIVGAVILGLFLLNQRLGATVKKRMQQIRAQALMIQTSEESLRITLDSIGDAVIATGVDGRITRINKSAAEVTGWSQADAVGQPLETVFQIMDITTRERRKNPVFEILEGNQILDLPDQTMLIAKDGTERLIADSGAPIRDEAGHCVGVVLVFRDVTEQRSFEKQLQQSQKMDAIGQLAGGVAHDFNNMLCCIIGSVEMLAAKLEPDSPGMKHVNLILKSTQRAADLTRKLLVFSRKSSFNTAAVNLHTILEETSELLSHALDKRIRIRCNLTAESSTVMGDLSQLQNVFLNLGINAGDAMPDGGDLSFSTRVSELDEAYCQNNSFDLEPGPHIVVEVRDTGTGIPLEMVSRIFEPFFTTKALRKGTGLGLSAAFGTIKQHAGAISVYSEEGNGTVFTVALPLASGSITSAPEKKIPIRGSGTVLVVDDEEGVRLTAEGMLDYLGYRVLTAIDGKDALQTYCENRSLIDLVLLDMVMPEMNGQECLVQLMELNPDLPVVLSSGFTDDANIEELKRIGLRGFIQKPYQTFELSQVVASALAEDGDEAPR